MLQYKFKKTAGETIIHMILDDTFFDGIVARPPSTKEIEHIEARARKKKVIEMLKQYTKLKESMNVQVTVEK